MRRGLFPLTGLANDVIRAGEHGALSMLGGVRKTVYGAREFAANAVAGGVGDGKDTASSTISAS